MNSSESSKGGLIMRLVRSALQETIKDLVLPEFQQLNRRIDGLDKRIDGLDKRIDGLDKRIDGLDKRIDSLEYYILGMREDFRITLDVQTRLAALEARMRK